MLHFFKYIIYLSAVLASYEVKLPEDVEYCHLRAQLARVTINIAFLT